MNLGFAGLVAMPFGREVGDARPTPLLGRLPSYRGRAFRVWLVPVLFLYLYASSFWLSMLSLFQWFDVAML